MRERGRQILDILLVSDGYVPVPEIASAIGAGIRTVFRDIIELEYSLREFGVTIEKKRSSGIRLLGDVSRLGRIGQNGSGRLSWLGVKQRQFAVLAYLGHDGRTVKLNELATVFCVSDSCISGDLKELDSFLRANVFEAELLRQKGIGVSLSGDEWSVRMAVLRCMSELIHPQDLVQLLLFGKDNARLEQLVSILGYTADRKRVLEALRTAESRMGYRFSWHDFGLAFMYLVIALERRNADGRQAGRSFANTPMGVTPAMAEELWVNSSGDNGAPADETLWLCGVLSALEPGEIRETNRSHPEIAPIVSGLIAYLGRDGNTGYDFDASLYMTLQLSLSALAYKKIFSLPVYGPPVSLPESDIEKRDRVYEFLRPSFEERFGIDLLPAEIEPVLMMILAAEESFTGERSKPRVLIACFEGICLAQFIASIIRTHFPDVVVVASLSCDRVSDEWIGENAVDLVITTFPSGLTAAPEYTISTPFDASSFRREISDVLSRVERQVPSAPVSVPAPASGAIPPIPDSDSGIDTVIGILQNFFLTTVHGDIPESGITAVLAREILGDGADATLLKDDFDKRESYGAVILEESGIRLFHCRSKSVAQPVAGVLRIAEPRKTFVYLVAPDPSPAESVRALSRISVALLESPGFTRALVGSEESEIKRQLFAVLASSM